MRTRILFMALAATLSSWLSVAQALPPATDGGEPGRPTKHALECVEDATSSLSAKPTEIALGESVTLTWSVDNIPSGCESVKFSLDGRRVGSSGTSTVKPLVSTIHVLKVTIPIPGGEAMGPRKEAAVKVKLPALVDIAGSTGQWRGLLVKALGTLNTTVRLSDGVDMDLSGFKDINIVGGVTLTGDPDLPLRGTGIHGDVIVPTAGVVTLGGAPKPPPTRRSARNLGPRIFTTTRPRPLFLIDGDNVRLSGFRLHGPQFGVEEDDDDIVKEIAILTHPYSGIEIADMQVAGWSGQAIYVQGPTSYLPHPAPVKIHDNFIHHNQRKGGDGYGVWTGSGANALIEHNVFDFNRHAISSGGEEGNRYRAYQNLVLKGGGVHGKIHNRFTHQFDVHGTDTCGIGHLNCGQAGQYFEVTNNAFQYTSDHAFKLRGTPRVTPVGALVKNNVFPHDSASDAVHHNGSALVIANTVGVDTYGQYGVCDIDGDGKDDLLLPTGVTWWYSSAGKMRWSYLNAATERLHQIGLGDFDGDRRCDVFAVHGNKWEIASGGTAAWSALPGTYSIPFDQLRFGDFNGDGVTDVFRRAPDGQWSVVSPWKYDWRILGSSSFPLSKLRFGDFNGDRVTDVLGPAGGEMVGLLERHVSLGDAQLEALGWLRVRPYRGR